MPTRTKIHVHQTAKYYYSASVMRSSCAISVGFCSVIHPLYKVFPEFTEATNVHSTDRVTISTGFRHTVYSVSQKKPWGFVAIFPKRLGIFRPNFTWLLCVPIYARLRIFIQVSGTLTKLCHIPVGFRFSLYSGSPKCLRFGLWLTLCTLNIHTYLLTIMCDHPFRSMVDILSTLWWSRLIWHNFVKVAGNWIKSVIQRR